MYSPLGLVIFVAVERTCMFYKRSRSLYFKFYSLQLLTPIPMQYRVPAKLHTGNIGRRHSARRQRIAPFDLRRASLPVAVAISYNVA